jgi:hypothetical protein
MPDILCQISQLIPVDYKRVSDSHGNKCGKKVSYMKDAPPATNGTSNATNGTTDNSTTDNSTADNSTADNSTADNSTTRILAGSTTTIYIAPNK